MDSDSTDGTKEYLSGLSEKGLIHKYLCERDFAQAHGCNKALLMADGELLKIINDDDVFYYKGIKKCKDFMLDHPEIDIIGMDGAGANFSDEIFSCGSSYPGYLNAFKKWKTDRTPFSFCDLGLMIRKSSLSYLGLFNPAFLRLDAEYTFRASSLPKTRMAWYSGHCFIRIANEMSISEKNNKNMDTEWNKLELIYLGKHPASQKIVSFMSSILKKLKYIIKKNLTVLGIIKKKERKNTLPWEEYCKKAEQWLEEKNNEIIGSFYY